MTPCQTLLYNCAFAVCRGRIPVHLQEFLFQTLVIICYGCVSFEKRDYLRFGCSISRFSPKRGEKIAILWAQEYFSRCVRPCYTQRCSILGRNDEFTKW